MPAAARTIAFTALAFSASLGTRTPVRSSSGNQGSFSVTLTLKDEITSADSALFAAFNGRDLPRFRTFFSRDLEFYQDNEGVENYAQTMKDFAQMFSSPAPIHRELVLGTLEVYAIKNYGAIEAGSHRFCHVENGKDDCGTFKFVHIWRRTKAGWKITRVVSYAH